MTTFIEKDWYPPGEIIFKSFQIRTFILPNFELFESGEWPPIPSSYVGGYSPNRSSCATYENPVLIHAEITERLGMCPDGEMLLDRYQQELRYCDIARLYHWQGDEINLERYVKQQLGYISGFDRKGYSFRRWLQLREAKKRFNDSKILTSDSNSAEASPVEAERA